MVGWIVKVNGVASEPVSAVVLKQMAAAGEIDASTLVRREDSDAWSPAGKIKGLFRGADDLNDPVSPVMSTDGFSSGVPVAKNAVGPPAETLTPYSPPTAFQAIGEHRAKSGKRRYPMIEIYAAIFRILGILVAVCGVFAAFLSVAMNPPSLLDAIVVAFGTIVGAALISFPLLLASQMIKLVLDVASDIEQMADRTQ